MQPNIESEKKQHLRTIARGVLSSVMSEVFRRIDNGEIEVQGDSEDKDKWAAIFIKEAIGDIAENLEVE